MTKMGLSKLGLASKPPPISWLMEVALKRRGLISLAAGFTDRESLPVEEVGAIVEEILSNPKDSRSALQYGTTQGDPELRELTARRLKELDGTYSESRISPEEIIVTHGSQQFLYLVVEALCDPGDIVLVEDPTYFVFLGLLQARGVKTRGVKLSRDGIDLDHFDYVLRRLCETGEIRRVKFFYIVSYAHNPTGITWEFERKIEVLKRLYSAEKRAGHTIYLVEDAAYRDLLFTKDPVPSALCGYSAKGGVIYVGTYTKPFATGIRVGFGIAPRNLWNVLVNLKGNHDFGTSNFIQRVIARALTTGRYQRHVKQLQKLYNQKAQLMAELLSQNMPDVCEVWNPTGGLYYWLKFPSWFNTGPKSKLFRRALEIGILYVPGYYCYAPDDWRKPPDCEIRLSYGNASEDEIRLGVKRLSRAIKELISKRS